MHQDTRKIRELGNSYREFVVKTSFVPFVALLSGVLDGPATTCRGRQSAWARC